MEIKRIQVESFRIPERAGLVWWAICEPETIHLHEASGRNKVIVKNRDLEAGAEKPDPESRGSFEVRMPNWLKVN